MEFVSICYEDFKNICRICLLFGKLEPFKELSVYHVFQSIRSTDIEVELEEKLPKNVCQNCIRDLENMSEFFLKCKNSDIVLKSIVNQKLDEDTSNESSKICSSADKIDTSVSENKTANPEVSEEVKTKKEMKITCNEVEDNISNVDNGLNFKQKFKDVYTNNKLFTCDYCSKTFERIFHLQEHINIHLGLKPFKCDFCDKCFAKRQTLKIHSYVHTAERPFKCEICEKSFVRRIDLFKHCTNIHKITLSGIKQPRRHISTWKKLKDVKTNDNIFVRKKNFNVKNSFTCNVCHKKFTHRSNWKYHISTHVYEKLYKCSICDWKGINKDNLNIHFKEFHVEKETHDLSKTIESKDTLNENVLEKVRHFLCSICGKTFTRKSTLNAHIKIHTGEKNFECSICGFRFILKCTLDRHAAVHRDEKQYKCNICGKRLSQKRYLLKHIKVFHGTEKRRPLKKEKNMAHFCSICGKGFAIKRSLKCHEGIHKTGRDADPKIPKDTKDFLCTECGKQFTFKCNLQRHILITHSGEKPFECSVCGDRFTAKSSLDHHLNIHNGVKPYQCENCQKSFRQPSSLRKHTLVHTGERRFKCDICEMKFKTSSHLKTHMKRHVKS